MDPLIHFHVTLTVLGLLFEQHITGPGVHLTPSDESTTKRMQFLVSHMTLFQTYLGVA